MGVAVQALATACGRGELPAESADLVITNARLVVGDGTISERTTLSVTDGRITHVTTGSLDVTADVVIDATGLTALPGLMDTHRHLLVQARPYDAQEMAEYVRDSLPRVLAGLLADGVTTIMSAADYRPAIVEVRERLRQGDVSGPRLVVTGPSFTAPDYHPAWQFDHSAWARSHGVIEVTGADMARVQVRELASLGVDGIKVIGDQLAVPDPVSGEDLLAAIVDEAHVHGLPVLAHALSVPNMLNVVDRSVDRLVHTPATGPLPATAGAMLREADIAIATTVSASSPAADAVRGGPWPFGDHEQILANIRTLWDDGVTVAVGTDSPLGLDFLTEARALESVLSPTEIITGLTANAAIYLGLRDEIGTLQPRMIADILIVSGDPLSRISDLANVELVIQGGVVVVDNR